MDAVKKDVIKLVDKRVDKIASTYGYDAQSRQCIEEMAELTQAINKYWRKRLNCGNSNLECEIENSKERDNMIEEIADVEIMLQQMKLFLWCNEEVERVKEDKLNRQIERIKIDEAKRL